MIELQLQLPHTSYPIRIGAGNLNSLADLVRSRCEGFTSVALIGDDAIAATHVAAAQAVLAACDAPVRTYLTHADEKQKSMESVQKLIAAMLADKHDRGCVVIAMGGGLVCDVAGFVAATYLRGVRVIQVPTTVLAMVDASTGGKTGVNFPLPAGADGKASIGKNLVGAFWQPRAVVIDPDVLATLDDRQFRCGMAETIKHAVVADADLFASISSSPTRETLAPAALEAMLAQSVSVKARIVEEDEREHGRRALLNFGHTFAHVIEPIQRQDLFHGEAVAIGMVAATKAAQLHGMLDEATASKIVSLVEAAGLPVRLREQEEAAALTKMMMYDKKTRGGKLHLVLPSAIGSAQVVDDVPLTVVEAAWDAVMALH